jgi:CheY-like chemotaxis protein
MNFKILYVEDDVEQASRIKKAVASSNADRKSSRPVLVQPIANPGELKAALNAGYDLVLADVYFNNEAGEPVNRLDYIIDTVETWSKDHARTRSLPIIAYTARGKSALDECLERSERLYDIWDKSSASPPYVAWRFKELALEFARARADTVLQRRIEHMTKGASWHNHVIDMARRYNAGWTERDQVEKCGAAIENIAHQLKTFDICHKYWEVMLKWEMLGRAISRRTRGHSRHVINVFWLGYYILHHDSLRDWFAEAWASLVTNRSDMGAVANEQPLEALSTAWYYASLFHDVAGCVEKNERVIGSTNEVLDVFAGFVGHMVSDSRVDDVLLTRAEALFYAFDEPLRSVLVPLWVASIEKREPDHGVVAAVHLTHELAETPSQLPYAREAARAMMTHNLIGKLSSKPASVLTWESEPLACLLILCDQVQTWDRTRGDQTIRDRDEPERAELSKLAVIAPTEIDRPKLVMDIDYLAPRHLDHAPHQLSEARDALEYILKDKPNRALARIRQPWPFGVMVQCWLNGQPLNTDMAF